MTNMQKTAVLAGASGLVGSVLLNILLESPSYKKIKIFARTPLNLSHPKLEQIIIDFDRLYHYAEQFTEDEIFCCLGTTIKKAGNQASFKKVDFEYPLTLAKLALKSNAKKFLIITAMGADENSKFFYNRVKGEVEEAIKKIGLPSVHIFQPSLLLGKRKEFRFGEKLSIILSPLYRIFLVGTLRKYNPIKATDVAKAMVVIAQKDHLGTYTYQSDQIFKLSKEM